MHFPDTETRRGWGRQPWPCHLAQFLLLILALPPREASMWLGVREKKNRKKCPSLSRQTLPNACCSQSSAFLPFSLLLPRDKPCGQPHPRTRSCRSSTGGVCANVGCAGERAAAGPAQRAGIENTQTCRRNVQSPQTDSGLGPASRS